jgi:hypothetical protein
MDLAAIHASLTRMPTVVDAMLIDLPEEWCRRNDGPGTWSAYDIVGHLLHGEATDWIPRTRIILEYGTARPFDPFDPDAMPRPAESMAARLDRFRVARAESLAALSTMDLSAADLGRRGRHPELGEVTLGQMLTTWATHDLTHVAQLGEVLARRNRDEVGPWRAYLTVLDRVPEVD